MMTFKTKTGEGISTNSDGPPVRGIPEKGMISTNNIEAAKARRKAEMEAEAAKIEAAKGAPNAKG